jgi:hypothetical protein
MVLLASNGTTVAQTFPAAKTQIAQENTTRDKTNCRRRIMIPLAKKRVGLGGRNYSPLKVSLVLTMLMSAQRSDAPHPHDDCFDDNQKEAALRRDIE